MSWTQQSSSNHFPQPSCSFTSPYNQNVKPNVHLLATNEATGHSTRTLHTVDVKQPPPWFSKSFDCKVGTTQVANLPNLSNPPSVIWVNPPQTHILVTQPIDVKQPPPGFSKSFESKTGNIQEANLPNLTNQPNAFWVNSPQTPNSNSKMWTTQERNLPNLSNLPNTIWVNPPQTPNSLPDFSQPPPRIDQSDTPLPTQSLGNNKLYDRANVMSSLSPINGIPDLPDFSQPPPKLDQSDVPLHQSSLSQNSSRPVVFPTRSLGNNELYDRANSTSSSSPINGMPDLPDFSQPPPKLDQSDVPLHQSSLSQNSSRPVMFPTQILGNDELFDGANARSSSSKVNSTPDSLSIHNFWQKPTPTALPLVNQSQTQLSSISSSSFSKPSNYDPPMSLPPLNLPPPSFIPNNPSTLYTRRIIQPFDNSFNPNQSAMLINDTSGEVTESRSNGNRQTTNEFSMANYSNFVAGTASDTFPISFNVPPLSFRTPQDPSNPKLPNSQIKTEKVNKYTPHSDSALNDQLSLSEFSCSVTQDKTLNQALKRPRSSDRQSCDHQSTQSVNGGTNASHYQTIDKYNPRQNRYSHSKRSRSHSSVVGNGQIRDWSDPRPNNENSQSNSSSSSRRSCGLSSSWSHYNEPHKLKRSNSKTRHSSQKSQHSSSRSKRCRSRSRSKQDRKRSKRIRRDLYYARQVGRKAYECTQKTRTICDQFESIIQKFASEKYRKKPFDYSADREKIKRNSSHCASQSYVSFDSESRFSSSGEENVEEDNRMLELELKQNHPDRLHPELWFNDKGEKNNGPLCRCSTKSRRSGIRHNFYAGEEQQAHCNPDTNNPDNLYHYRVRVSPLTNFRINKPTVIEHDGHKFIFEGFSIFSHHPLEKLPACRVIRFNIEYTIVYIEEKVPNEFSVRETELFFNYLFHEVLELVDLDLKSPDDKDGCPRFHIMPRFVRKLKDNRKELLPMYRVLEYFTSSFKPVISKKLARAKCKLSTFDWRDFADTVKGMVIVKPGVKPCAIRVDQLDRESETNDIYPVVVHFRTIGSSEFPKLWKDYIRHLVANNPKKTEEDNRKLGAKQQRLQEITDSKGSVTVAVSSRGFYRTGIMCDMVQHALMMPVLFSHLRYHHSLNVLECRIKYKFKNRSLLQLALTLSSYQDNFGTNPDHVRNSLSNCGVRQPEYGDRKININNKPKKRGINTLIDSMSKQGKKVATESNITNNERLEFLGDAVVEFISSVHLFHIFPDIGEGGLSTYRTAIVQNLHLAHLAKKIALEDFMLYTHGADLCREENLKQAMANCFEALMAALFLDGGIQVADRVFSSILFTDEAKLYEWMNYAQHPLQEQEPDGDRHWVKMSPLLKDLQSLEYSCKVIFKHIRLLARVFATGRMGNSYLTMGSNQRLEFLGDCVLQLITTVYLYNHFPEHDEGHLTLLRDSLVSNKTLSVVSTEIGMPFFAKLINPEVNLKMKNRADLLEAFLGAMYIDKGMEACEAFCKVCFFPRLQNTIQNQEWDNPKAKLQRDCQRTQNGAEHDNPTYKVIRQAGPPHSREYTVAGYFKDNRLAKNRGNSIQQAEMNAAKVALQKFPRIFLPSNYPKSYQEFANTKT